MSSYSLSSSQQETTEWQETEQQIQRRALQILSNIDRNEYRHNQSPSDIRQRFKQLSDFQKFQATHFIYHDDHLTSFQAVPSVEDIVTVVRQMCTSQIVTILTPVLKVHLRRSNAPYHINATTTLPRIDIVNISVNPLFRERGVFTTFLKRLTMVANHHMKIPRVVMIQSVIGPKLRQLIKRHPQQYTPVQGNFDNFIYEPSVPIPLEYKQSSSRQVSHKQSQK